MYVVTRDSRTNTGDRLELWDNSHTKRRFYNLLDGLPENVIKLKARSATRKEILLVHSEAYFESIDAKYRKGCFITKYEESINI